MKNVLKKIFVVITVAGFILACGILGGIECGEPLSNAWRLIPIGIVTIVSALLGGLLGIEVEK